jgi:serine/threonine protein kinase
MKSPSGPQLELPVALDIMLQVAEAMLYLHTKKIVHRDMKAANILINHAKIEEMEKAGYVQAKVADLGESKIKLSVATYSRQTLAGTTRWMAPELFEKKSSDEIKYPFKADVYSYAITCSEILNMGKLPFADIEKQSELKEAVRKGIRPTLPDSLPLSVMSLIEQCWDGDASMRPSFSRICTELRHIKNLHMISNVVTKLKGMVALGLERVEA